MSDAAERNDTQRIVVAANDSAAAAVEKVCAAAARRSETILVLLDAAMPQPDRAMMIAAISPLAVELAPGTRLALLDIHAGAKSIDVEAAATFLVAATSTTGQILTIA